MSCAPSHLDDSEFNPNIPFNFDIIDKMMKAGCCGREIAARFGVHPNTLYNRVKREKKCDFSEYLASKKADGEATLKEKQYDKAINGDTTLLIWLGKCRLQQTEIFTTFNSEKQDDLDKDQKIMQLEHKLAVALAVNDNKSQTE